MKDPFNDPPTGRNPDSVLGLISLMVITIGILISETPPNSVDMLVGGFWGLVWAALILICAGICLFGIYHRNYVTALLLERISRLGLGVTCTLYGLAVFYGTPLFSNLLGPGLVFGFGLASLWRAGQLHGKVRRLSEHHHDVTCIWGCDKNG